MIDSKCQSYFRVSLLVKKIKELLHEESYKKTANYFWDYSLETFDLLASSHIAKQTINILAVKSQCHNMALRIVRMPKHIPITFHNTLKVFS